MFSSLVISVGVWSLLLLPSCFLLAFGSLLCLLSLLSPLIHPPLSTLQSYRRSDWDSQPVLFSSPTACWGQRLEALRHCSLLPPGAQYYLQLEAFRACECVEAVKIAALPRLDLEGEIIQPSLIKSKHVSLSRHSRLFKWSQQVFN